MVALTASNQLLEFQSRSDVMFLPRNERSTAEPFCPIDLSRSLSRWENEGGALGQIETVPERSSRAMINLRSL
jgi:hypothetical protein